MTCFSDDIYVHQVSLLVFFSFFSRFFPGTVTEACPVMYEKTNLTMRVNVRITRTFNLVFTL